MELSATSSTVSSRRNLDPEWATSGGDERHRRLNAKIPWPLLIFCGAALFPVFNQFGSQLYPNEEQSTAIVIQQTQAGDPVNQIAIVTIGLIGTWLIFRYRDRIHLQPRIASILFALLAWSVCSLCWSIDPGLTGKRLIELALVASFCAGVALRVSNVALSVFFAAFTSTSLLAGLVYEVVRGLFHPLRTGYRFCGTAPHPNVEGSFLSAAIIVLAWLCFRTAGKSRLLFLSLLLIDVTFMIFTRSRTSLLALLVALTFSFALVLLRDHRRRVGVVVASLILVVGLSALLDLVVPEGSTLSPFATALRRSDDEGGPASLSGRVDLWKDLLPYIQRRPITGYGFAGFWTPKHIENVSADQKWAIQQGHSGYIDQALALGIPGMILYIGLLFCCIGWGVFQFSRGDDGCGAWAAFLVFLALHNITESINVSFSFTNLMFYLIVFRFAIVRPEAVKH